ncbi:hypothetical protein [Ralstonia sp. ASV6]|uniref:hypothetical protein n=1 Tax=Ralstonia sp. ASV6 TaxID=2795124 RepID=UPI0018EE08AB|nr:hypothetical protein [Ralstonia sp. ASV6]
MGDLGLRIRAHWLIPLESLGGATMGEAKRNKEERQAWYADLTESERVIADVSQLAHARLAKNMGYVGACYFLAFFLRKYLREEKGVDVQPVVGWASSRVGMFAHAWIESDGKRTDLSLTQTTSNLFPPGDLIILDRVIKKGVVSYAYHPNTTAEIERVLQADGADGVRRLGDVDRMRRIGASDVAIDEYFMKAPPGYRYSEVLAHLA